MAMSVKALALVNTLSLSLRVRFLPREVAFLSKKGKTPLLSYLENGSNL